MGRKQRVLCLSALCLRVAYPIAQYVLGPAVSALRGQFAVRQAALWGPQHQLRRLFTRTPKRLVLLGCEC